MIPVTKLSYVLILSYSLYHQKELYRHPLDCYSNEQSINKLQLYTCIEFNCNASIALKC